MAREIAQFREGRLESEDEPMLRGRFDSVHSPRLFATPLYPIVDVAACRAVRLDPVEVGRRIGKSQPSLMQLRDKTSTSGDFLRLATALRDVTEEQGTTLVINDRVDLAVMAGARFVHVGQADWSVAEVRRLAPRLGIGVSCHTLAQLKVALAQTPDYVAFGPVFATQNKRESEPVVGIAELERAHDLSRKAGIALVAIGGINETRLSQVRSRAEAVAAIGLFFSRGGSLDAVEEQARRATMILQ